MTMRLQSLPQKMVKANNILYLNGFANVRTNMGLHKELSQISSMIAPNTKIDICSLKPDNLDSQHEGNYKGYYFASTEWQKHFDQQIMNAIEYGLQSGYDGIIIDNCGDRPISNYGINLPVIDVIDSAMSVCYQQEAKTLSMIVDHKYIIPAIQENLIKNQVKNSINSNDQEQAQAQTHTQVSFRPMYDCNLDDLFKHQTRQGMYYWDRYALLDFVDQVINEDQTDYVILNCHCDIEAVAFIAQRYPEKIVYPNTCALVQACDAIVNGIPNQVTQNGFNSFKNGT
eukprot:104573_1